MKRALLLVAGIGLALSASAQEVDPAQSFVKVTARQMNVPFEGQFRAMRGQLDWNEKDPTASRATVEVDLASFDLGEPSFNDEARSKAFLDAVAFPRARFATTGIRALGGGHFEASGQLTIKGVSRSIVVPFTMSESGGRRVFDASFPLRRLEFRIGEGEWSDTRVLADDTQVRVHLTTMARAR